MLLELLLTVHMQSECARPADLERACVPFICLCLLRFFDTTRHVLPGSPINHS
jgi:hypothetical protein